MAAPNIMMSVTASAADEGFEALWRMFLWVICAKRVGSIGPAMCASKSVASPYPHTYTPSISYHAIQANNTRGRTRSAETQKWGFGLIAVLCNVKQCLNDVTYMFFRILGLAKFAEFPPTRFRHSRTNLSTANSILLTACFGYTLAFASASGALFALCAPLCLLCALKLSMAPCLFLLFV
jgi:hypothetical protein